MTMEIPKFTAPTTILPNLSLTDTVKNASSQVGNLSIPTVPAPNLGVATPALGGLGGIGASVDKKIGAVQGDVEKLTGPAKARFMSSMPQLPERATGLKGIMEKGIDTAKFQEKSVANLMSKVSPFTPGKSMISLGKISNLSAGLKDKLSALGGGAVGKTIASGLTGALGGAALGKLVGGQPVNLKGIAGNLVGAAAGGIGANIGSSLVGSNVTGMTGIGAVAGGAISGIIGGSAGKKALTGLATGIGISALTGAVTNAMGLNTGNPSQTQQPNNEAPQPNNEAPQTTGGSTPPDISKNNPEEVSKLANDSPQSVPESVPPPQKPSAITNPPVETEIQYLKKNTPTISIDNVKDVAEKRKTSDESIVKQQFVGVNDYQNGLDFMSAVGIFTSKYKSMFGSNNFEFIRSKLAVDISRVTPTDRARVKSLISSFPKNFSLAYMQYPLLGDESHPEKRQLGLNDYIAMDTEDFYKFLTTVAEGDFELNTAEKSIPYKIFVNQKSPSEVTITISHQVYGTATGIIPRAVPPPINELFDIKGMKECIAAYNLGKNIESDQPSGLWNALDPYDGSLIRMYAFNSPNDKQNAFACANKIIISSTKVAVATGNSKGAFKNLKDTPVEAAGRFGGWVGMLKVEEDKYFRIQYNPYTIQIFLVDFFKMVPKT